MRFSARACLVLAASVCAGCQGGSTDGPTRYGVSGQVQMDGGPLDEGLITFVPDGFEGPAAGGEIKGGAYAIPRGDGPIAGKHKVSVFSRKPTGKKVPDPSDPNVLMDELVETVPSRYNLMTELGAEVSAGGDNRFDFDLKGRVNPSSGH